MTGVFPKIPGWAPESIKPIEALIRPEHVIFEWGTGLSTPWLAERAQHVVSMDDDTNWKAVAQRICRENRLNNVDFFVYNSTHHKYVATVFYFSEFFKQFDIIIIDGVERVNCFLYAIDYIKMGGFIIFDDFERSEYSRSREYIKAMESGKLSMEIIYGTAQKTAIFRKIT